MAAEQNSQEAVFNLHGQRVLVVGMGASGVAAAVFLQNKGALVTVTDQNSHPEKADEIRQLTDRGVRAELGGHRAESFEGADLIVISPGVPTHLPVLVQAQKKGVPVIGELELASRFIQPPLIAVSGTNGKSTVTMLLAHLLRQAGYRVGVGGNIGTPLVSFADQTELYDVLVVEVSSFQLDTIKTFQPAIGILLNITPDHLDRYDDFEAYVASKARLFENQQKAHVAILNGRDPWVRHVSRRISAQRWFVSAEQTEEGSIFQGHRMVYQTAHHRGEVDLSELKLPGYHNKENTAAALLAAIAFGAAPPAIEAALSSFKGLSHRIEWVAEKQGISFYDDSKATNIDAVAKALEAFDVPVVLIMGGRNKGYKFTPLLKWIKGRLRLLVTIGEAGPDILQQIGTAVQSRQADTMEEAVYQAFSAAHPGDVVLLSPGCASFDMFTSYAHRGEVFCNAVNALKK